MCLAIPGKIISVDRSTPELAMATADFGGILKQVCIQWVDAEAGDYVLTHAGLAITVVDPAEAQQTWADLDAIAHSLQADSDEIR
jgi:hydrogenase expression/formation protein HypC